MSQVHPLKKAPIKLKLYSAAPRHYLLYLEQFVERFYRREVVDVDISVFANLAEALYSYRVFHIRVA